MLIKKTLIACILAVVLLTVLTACGGNSTTSSSQQATDQQATDQQAADQQTTDQTTGYIAPTFKALPTEDPKATVDSLLGSWTGVSSSDRFANITKTDNGYQYQDNDNTYQGTFIDGILKVQVVSPTDTADVFIDVNTGHMFTVYQGDSTEFKKK